jgi:O-antigen ligase
LKRIWIAAICAVLAVALLLNWVPGRWATSVLEVGAFTITFAWIAMAGLRADRWRWSAILMPPAVLCGSGALQIAFGGTVTPSDTAGAALTWAACFGVAFVGLQIFGNGNWALFARWLLAFGAVLCVVSALEAYTAPGRVFWIFPIAEDALVMGPFLNHSHYAAFVELLLPLALVPAVRRAPQWRYIVVAAILLATLVASASRGGVVVAAVETAGVLALCIWRQRIPVRSAGIILAALTLSTVVSIAVVGWTTLGERLKRGDATEARLQMLRSSIDMIRDHGVTGSGLASWPAMYPRYARYDDGLAANQAHNDWVQWVAEVGLAGGAAVLVLLVVAVRIGWRTTWCAGPLFVLLHAAFDYPFQKPPLAALVFVLLAAGACAIDDQQQNKT